jgi:hypothetical protein
MKKTAGAHRTLRLDREAIRRLSSSEVAHIAGGGIVPVHPTFQITVCPPCTTGPKTGGPVTV